MKPKVRSLFTAFSLLQRTSLMVCVAFGASNVHADQTWIGGTDDSWLTADNWSGLALPGAGDVVTFDLSATGNFSNLLNADFSVRGLEVVNPITAVTIGGNTLTIGDQGIDMSVATQSLTINSAVVAADGGKQMWNISTGQTLSLAAAPTKATVSACPIEVSTTGVAIFDGVTTTNLIADTAGNPWITLGANDWAGLDAGIVVASTYTDATTALVGGAVNDIKASLTGANGTDVLAVRFNEAAAYDVTVSNSGTARTMTGRGILVTANSGGGSIGGNLRNNAFLRPNRTSGFPSFNIIQNSAADFTIGAILGNASSGVAVRVVKSGPGKVISLQNNAYTAGTFIDEGTLQFGDGSAISGFAGYGFPGGGDIVNHGSLVFMRASEETLIHNISGTGSFTQAGPGILNLTTSVSTFTGDVNITGGTLGVTSMTNLGNGTGINIDNGILKFLGVIDPSARSITIGSNGAGFHTNGNDITLANAFVSGSTGSLTKSGIGTLTLTAANDYSGGTIVNEGTLSVTGTGATGSGTVTVNSGGTLAGTGSVDGAVDVASGGSVAPGASVGTLSVGGLTMQSGSTATFEFNSSPANDQITVVDSDGLTIDGGAISLVEEGGATPFTTPGTYNLIAYSGSIGGAGTTALSIADPQPGFSYAFDTSGGFVTLTISTAGVIGDWTNAGGGSWADVGNWGGSIPDGAGDLANFQLDLGAPASITLDGSKTVAAVTFQSATNGYTIAEGSGGSLILDHGGSDASIQVLAGGHTISAPVTLNSNTVVDAAAATDSIILSGVVGGAGSLTKTGAGVLNLTNTNTYAGATTITGGLIEFAAADSLSTGSVTLDGGGLRWAAGNTLDPSTGLTTTFLAGGAVFDTNGNDVAVSGVVGGGGAGRLTKQGAGTLTLSSDQTFQGGLSILGGTVSIGNDSALGTIPAGPTPGNLVIDNGVLELDSPFAFDANRGVTISGTASMVTAVAGDTITINGSIDGAGLLSLEGAGTWYLNSTTSSYSGGTTVAGGELHLGAYATAGTGLITLDNATLVTEGSLSIYNALPNNVDVPAGATSSLMLSGRVEVGGSFTGAVDSTLNVGVNYVRDNINGNWSGFSGQINVSGSGEFRINNANGFGNAKLSLGDGVFMYQIFNPPSGVGTQTVQNIGELSGSAGAILGGNPVGGRYVNWTIGALNTDSTFAGVIQNDTDPTVGYGEPIVTKVGTGTLTLTNVNTYTGPTMVLGGVLSLGASGSIAGSTHVTIGAGAVLDTTGQTLVIPATQPVTFGVDGADAGSCGRIDATGQELNITDAVVDFTVGNALDDAVYILADYGTLTGGAFASVTVPDGYSINYAYNGGTQIALVADAGSDYDTWSANYAPADITDTAGDNDGDGLANYVEYAFGLSPVDGSSVNPILAGLNKSAGTFTYQRRDDALTGLVYKIWYSTDLVAWTEDSTAVQDDSAGPDINGVEPVAVTLTTPPTGDKFFFRVTAE